MTSCLHGKNPYQFVGSGPVGATDPSGFSLPQPQQPARYRLGKWKKNGNEWSITRYYTQDLGVIIVKNGTNPKNTGLQNAITTALDGLTAWSALGSAIKDILNQLTARGEWGQMWRGTAFPKVTYTYVCKAGGSLKKESVKYDTWADPTWTLFSGGKGTSIVAPITPNDFEQTASWFGWFQDVMDAFKKATEAE